MKTYAIFIFNDDKKGFERYHYIGEVETKYPEHEARVLAERYKKLLDES